MSFKIPTLAYTGSIRSITLEKNGKKVTVGGENSYPFYSFEGEMHHLPKVAIQVPDFTPDDWSEVCLEPYKDVLGNPVAWAKKAQDVYKADIIFLWLKSTDPNGLNRSADEAAGLPADLGRRICPLRRHRAGNVRTSHRAGCAFSAGGDSR